jgi:hemerythrin superfamily protein
MAENVEANAIDMLEGQHREVEDLFAKLEKADRGERKQKLFTLIADKLAVHASIEEEAF